MAKKRGSKSVSAIPKAAWPEHVVIHLLSWLDITTQHKDIDLDKTVVAHLQQKCQKDYTFTQIESKLKRLWKTYGSNDSDSYQDLLLHGHFCLDYLRHDVKHQIELGFQALEADLRKNPKTNKISTRKSSKLKVYGRASSQASLRRSIRTRKPLNRHDTNRKVSVTPIKLKRRNASFTPEANKQAWKKRKLNGGSTTSSTISPCLSDGFSYSPGIDDSQDGSMQIHSGIGRDPTSSPSEISKDSQSINTFVHTVENHTTHEEIRCVCSSTGETISWIQCNKCSVWQHCICVGVEPKEADTMDYLCEQCSPNAHHEKYKGENPSNKNEHTQTEKGLQVDDVLLDLAKEEILRLRAKLQDKTVELRESEQYQSDFEREARLLRSNKKQMENNSSEYLLEQRDKEIMRLRKELEERRSLSRFTKLGIKSHQVLNEDTIENISDVFAAIEQLPCRNDSIILPPQWHQFKTPENFISETFAKDGQSLQFTKELEANLASMNTHIVLRALTASFLKVRIFESDFPVIEGSSSHYVAKLREILVVSDGNITARNLDLAIRHAIITDQSFKAVFVEPEVERLTILYSNIMEILFSQHPRHNIGKSWDGFSTWNDDKDIWQDRQNRLLDIIRLALRTKAESTLNLKDYEIVTFVPGTPYDHHSMSVETSNSAIDDKNNDGHVIEVCIQPAVYVYSQERLGNGARVSSSVPQNFVRNSGRRKAGLEPSIKAVVVIREGDMDS